MERKIFLTLVVALGLIADLLVEGFHLSLWWTIFATIPIVVLSWWIAYRSEWFG